jgi:hypothetical protein
MGSKSQVIVCFVCAGCSVAYVATQNLPARVSPGRFGCFDCHAQVYAWTGPFDYSEWRRIEEAATDL